MYIIYFNNMYIILFQLPKNELTLEYIVSIHLFFL